MVSPFLVRLPPTRGRQRPGPGRARFATGPSTDSSTGVETPARWAMGEAASGWRQARRWWPCRDADRARPPRGDPGCRRSGCSPPGAATSVRLRSDRPLLGGIRGFTTSLRIPQFPALRASSAGRQGAERSAATRPRGERPGPVVVVRVGPDAVPVAGASAHGLGSAAPGVMPACGHGDREGLLDRAAPQRRARICVAAGGGGHLDETALCPACAVLDRRRRRCPGRRGGRVTQLQRGAPGRKDPRAAVRRDRNGRSPGPLVGARPRGHRHRHPADAPQGAQGRARRGPRPQGLHLRHQHALPLRPRRREPGLLRGDGHRKRRHPAAHHRVEHDAGRVRGHPAQPACSLDAAGRAGTSRIRAGTAPARPGRELHTGDGRRRRRGLHLRPAHHHLAALAHALAGRAGVRRRRRPDAVRPHPRRPGVGVLLSGCRPLPAAAGATRGGRHDRDHLPGHRRPGAADAVVAAGRDCARHAARGVCSTASGDSFGDRAPDPGPALAGTAPVGHPWHRGEVSLAASVSTGTGSDTSCPTRTAVSAAAGAGGRSRWEEGPP